MTTPHPARPARPATPARPARLTATLQLIRALCHLIVVIAVGVWAFLAWPLPWPGLAAGIGLTLLTILVWALFLSPRPVLRTDRFGLGLIELLFIGAGVAALLGLGTPWLLAVAFGLIAAALGYVVPERLR